MVDVNEMRSADILLHGLTGADRHYTVYYDETNNIRVLRNTPDGFNVRRPKVFVLGGIAHAGGAMDLDFDALRTALPLPGDVSELKFNQIGSGGFLDVLKSRKLTTFLQWIGEQNLFVHFQALDVLYWSIVDIIDSIIGEAGEPGLYALHAALKDDLYSVLRSDETTLAALLHKYDFPNVGGHRRVAFLNELVEITEVQQDRLDPFAYQMLKGILEIGQKLDSLPYLENEHPNLLLDSFANFYVHRICLLKNSEHVLDIEKVIQRQLEAMDFMDGTRQLQNHHFADSKNEVGIQVSDALVGLIGRAFTYANTTETEAIEQDLEGLTEVQKLNLSLLRALVEASLEENPIFAHYIISMTDQTRMDMILNAPL